MTTCKLKMTLSCAEQGGASINVSTATNTLSFAGGASAANICSGVSIYRGAGAACAATGTLVQAGTGPAGLKPVGIADIVTTFKNNATDVSVLTIGKDYDLDGDTLEILSAGSNLAVSNNASAQGGTLSINNNSSPLNFLDDFITYTPPAGFLGVDEFSYVIEDEQGVRDTVEVSVFVIECGSYIELLGSGANGIATTSLNFSDTTEIDSIVMESIYKGVAPTSITFSSSTQTIVNSSPVAAINGGGGYFRTKMNSASSISATTTNTSTTQSLVAYVYRRGTSREHISERTRRVTTLHENSLQESIRIPSASEPRNILLEIPISELNVDARTALVEVSYGSITKSLEVKSGDLGASLKFFTVILEDVPGNITQLTLSVTSRVGLGDSFVVSGANLQIQCGSFEPEAGDVFATTALNARVSIDVLQNTSDLNNDIDTSSLTNLGVLPPNNGSIGAFSSGSVTYTPNTGFNGIDAFQFKVCDKTGICDIATVYVTVSCASGNFVEAGDFFNLDLGGTKEGGLTWADFNNDGLLDVLVNTSNTTNDSRIYFANKQGILSFVDVTSSHAAGLLDNNLSRTALAGDMNNDGYVDFVRNEFNRIEVFFNRGPDANPAFNFGNADQDPNVVITAIAGGMNTEGMVLLDWNQDGWLDLVMDNDNNGAEIFENDKDGTFTLQTLGTGAGQTGFPASLGDNGDYAAMADWDNDGYPDVIFRKDATNANGVDLWNFNPSTGRFDAVTSPNIAGAGGNKGAVTFCDLDNDADLDFIWTDGSGTANNIYTNSNGTFSFHATLLNSGGIDDCDCADVDNDGDLDIFLGDNSGASYLYINNVALSFSQANGCLDPNANVEGSEFVDFDGDGDMDLYMNIAGGANQLWVNMQNDDNYLFIEPRIRLANGEFRSAIGANVLLTNCDNDTFLLQEVSGGRGHGSQKPAELHFGLGNDGPDIAYTAIVYFADSSGVRDTVNVNFVPSHYLDQKLIVYQSNPDNENYSDIDNDGVIDIQDIDTDGDGILNTAEIPLGVVSPYKDSDFDGVYDYLDEDFEFCGGIVNGVCSNFDTDGDGIADFIDRDSDGDGITDVVEAGGTDSDGVGIIDNNSSDTDGDGYPNAVDSDNGGTALSDSDTDGDGVPTRLDNDSDGDGIPEIIEAQTTLGYTAPSGVDTDEDGIDNQYDSDCSPCGAITGFVVSPVNSDGADLPDYLDTDSDNDGITDLIEANDFDYNDIADISPSGADADSDGIDNAFDDDAAGTINNGGPDNNQSPASFLDTRPSTADKNWREARLPIRSTTGAFTVSASCPVLSGSNWIDIDDGAGNIVFSINPNGNNLGASCWGVNILSGVPAVRIDTNGGFSEYILNRNFYIDPTTDPGGNVSLRLYALTSEVDDLRTAVTDDGFAVGTFQNFIDDSLKVTQSEPSPLNLNVFDNAAAAASLKNPDNMEYNALGYGFNLSTADMGEFVPFFIPGLPAAALSLKLFSFEAIKNANRALLRWTSLRPEVIDHFEIERTQDVLSWTSLTQKTDINQSNDAQQFVVFDEDPHPSMNYYRIKTVFADFSYEYSEIRALNFDDLNGSTEVMLSPNPNRGSFVLSGLEEGEYTVEIYDALGALVSSESFSTLGQKRL